MKDATAIGKCLAVGMEDGRILFPHAPKRMGAFLGTPVPMPFHEFPLAPHS